MTIPNVPSNVTDLTDIKSGQKRPYKRAHQPSGSREVTVREMSQDGRELLHDLERLHLESDARSIWMAYSNLNAATQTLLKWTGPEWPCADNPSHSAVTRAVQAAIESVRKGYEDGYHDRRLVIANYYRGLSTIASDIASHAVLAYQDNTLVGTWRPYVTPLREWAIAEKADRLVYVKRDVDPLERHGLEWVIRVRIAPITDIGLIDKFG